MCRLWRRRRSRRKLACRSRTRRRSCETGRTGPHTRPNLMGHSSGPGCRRLQRRLREVDKRGGAAERWVWESPALGV